MKNTYFYRDKPIFGIDIGNGTIRIMQINGKPGNLTISGYSAGNFEPSAIKNGVIVEPQVIANLIQMMLSHNLKGSINSKRIALALPAKRTYSRAIKLPKLEPEELESAILLEAEQYIPVSIKSLYLDYNIISQTETELELFMVATPITIIDSYMNLAKLLDFEPVLIETSIDSASRLFVQTHFGNVPSVLVDFGQESVDITIVDGTIIATGTVGGGGDNFTTRISDKLGVSPAEAHNIKTKYGLNISNKQNEITMALDPQLELLYKEIKRMIRYYEERTNNTKKINQIVIMGNGANLPGLADRMTDVLRVPVQTSDPWQLFKYKKGLEPIPIEIRSSFITAAGLAIAPPKEVFK